MSGPWGSEIWRGIWMVGLATLLGAIVGRTAFGLIVGLMILLGYHFLQMRRLEHWMRSGSGTEPPDVSGLWSEFYHRHYRLRRRNQARKRQLMQMLSRFNQSASALPDATVVLGERGEIQWFNEAARRSLGLRQPDDLGHRIDNLIRYPEFTAYLRSGDYAERVEIPAPGEDDHVLSIAVVPYGDNQLLLVAQDVTRVMRLEQMRQDFIANISHELKTPLTVINGYLETMCDSSDPQLEKYERSLNLMQQQTHRMRSIVEDLLFLSRLEGARMAANQPVNIPELLDAIRVEAEALARRAPKPHQIVLDIDRLLWLSGDEAELRSAFANLVYNAINYSPEGGKIILRWQLENAAPRFSVVDQGMGIASAQIPRITERFYRVDESRSRQSGGTGLGLSIVKHVLVLHQAELKIESQVGKGSTFSCVFPAEKAIIKSSTPILPFGGSDHKRRSS